MALIGRFSPGDPVYVTWEMLVNVPAIVRVVHTGGEWLNVAIDPKDLEAAHVERGGFFRIHPATKMVHLVVRNTELEPRTGTITYGPD